MTSFSDNIQRSSLGLRDVEHLALDAEYMLDNSAMARPRRDIGLFSKVFAIDCSSTAVGVPDWV